MIDEQFKLCRLQDRQIRRLFTLQNATRIHADLPIYVRDAGAVTHQTSDRDKFSGFIYRRDGIASRQRHDLIAPTVEERIANDS
jgi:hypothetical protein